MDQIFDSFDVLPNYATGFEFAWAISQGFTAPAPWYFWVQRAETPDGPWTDMSGQLQDVYGWAAVEKLIAPKDPVLYFRIKARIGTADYYSHVKQPYGDLSRREFLLAQNMQRHELLQMCGMSGVRGNIWLKSIFGPACTTCTDFVGGNPTDSSCADCFGTGRRPGYHGPYPTWLTFSPARRKKHMSGDKHGVREDYTFTVRMLGTPRVKKDDILIDSATDKRYYVDAITNVAEMRRIPIVQQVLVNEIPVSSPLYRIGA
jgi:hypothetical protein